MQDYRTKMGATLQLRVKDKASGGALRGVAIRAGMRSQFNYSQFGNFATGEAGTCTIVLPEQSVPTLLLTVFRDEYVPRFLRWAVDHGDDLPSTYTLALEKGITIGGIVRNEQGEPVPGAKVTLQASSSGYDASSREWSALNRDQFPVLTDGKGVWRCGFAPADLSEITIHVEHSEYALTYGVTEDRNYVHETQIVPKGALLAGSAVVVLSPGFPISGRITGPDGQPVANAAVTVEFGVVRRAPAIRAFGARREVPAPPLPDSAFAQIELLGARSGPLQDRRPFEVKTDRRGRRIGAGNSQALSGRAGARVRDPIGRGVASQRSCAGSCRSAYSCRPRQRPVATRG